MPSAVQMQLLTIHGAGQNLTDRIQQKLVIPLFLDKIKTWLARITTQLFAFLNDVSILYNLHPIEPTRLKKKSLNFA